MRRRNSCIFLSVMALLLLSWTFAAAERTIPMPQERSTPWGTSLLGSDDQRRYEPVDINPRYRYAVPPRHYPPPYYFYYPHYEQEKRWYEEDLPIPAGRVVMLVDPIQAQVFVNGYAIQRQADLTYEAGLLHGKHQIEVKADGYAPYQQAVNIQGGEMIRLTIRLEKDETSY